MASPENNTGVPSADDPFGGYVGKRSDFPQPRALTPDSIRKVEDVRKTPAPYRNFEIKLEKVDVVYAEDEEVFRETAVRQLVRAGFSKANIHESDSGFGALEDLISMQFKGNLTMPLVVLLDIRMPGMDGRECALQIQELVKKRQLIREPFVICISSLHQQVIVQEGKGNFQVVLPKPFTAEHVNECVKFLTGWWTTGICRALPAWKTWSRDIVDLIIAGHEPISRMHAIVAFGQAGVSEEQIKEADDSDELQQLLDEAQEEVSQKPLAVLLMNGELLVGRRGGVKRLRDPFLIYTAEGHIANEEDFDAFLPFKFGRREVEWCLELLRLWWLTRGDGPADVDESDAESASEAGSNA